MFTWLPYAAYSLLGIALLAWINRRRHAAQISNSAVLKEAIDASLTTPPSLHPIIDHTRCIGCKACVHACPEFPAHKVLGVIRGKAHLVGPTDCIGHGACKTACPVDAIRLVFGTEERGVDIPTVKPSFETNVPGIYIAGELGGMGLIKNAIEQGRQAMQNIVDARKGKMDALDVLIVGAGPAGFSATLTAHAAGVRYKTVEQDTLGGTVAHFPRRKLVMTAPAKLDLVGMMNFRETEKETLMAYWEAAAKKSGIQISCGETVEAIEPQGKQFRVTTSGGEYAARTVLLALGRMGTPRQLGAPGEHHPKVVYRLIDPDQYAGMNVLVVGGGDSALEAATSLAEADTKSVTLSYRSKAFARAKQKNREKVEQAARDGTLDVLLESNVTKIEPDKVHLDTVDGPQILKNEAIIVCAGGILPTAFLKSTGISVETKHGTE